MKKFLFLILILTISCVPNIDKTNLTNKFEISEKMSFEQILTKFKEYAENSNYPNIEN